MPSPAFSRDITAIFSNSQLRNSLKQDITCRLVCDTLGISSASMLMYHAGEDRLLSTGSYVAPSCKSHFTTGDRQLEEIVDNIILFEFFDSQLYEKSLVSLSFLDFKHSILWNRPHPPVIDEATFEDLKTKWTQPHIRNIYSSYKNALHSEAYPISSDSVSGNFFSRLLLNKNTLVNDIEVKDLASVDTVLGFHAALREINIQLPDENIYYIGVPLFATERYTGVLRLGVSTIEPSDLLEAVSQSPGEFRKTSLYERLNNFAQLISLHMKTDYYLAGYRIFGNMMIDMSGNFRIEESELSNVCDTMVAVINCNGCIIRFSESRDSADPPIKATSTRLRKYSEYIGSKTGDEGRFSEDIYNILKTGKHHGSRVMAIIFSVNDVERNTFDTREFFHDAEGYLKSEEVSARVFADFTPAYIKKLHELKMREVMVLPIDDVDMGIIILTNTRNRFFTSSDVEMALLAAKRLQLEIKVLQGLEQQKKDELQKAQISGMNIVIHQFGQVIKSSADTMEEISDRLDIFKRKQYGDEKNIPDDFAKISQNLKLLGFLIMHSQNQILRANRITQIGSQPIVPKNKVEFDLNTFLKKKCKDFDPYARVERGLHIWLLNAHRSFDRFETDIELLTEVIYNLLDNAVKYSFNASEMRSKGVSHDEHNYRSEGNILVDYSISYDQIIITVTSWGPTIARDELHLLFDKAFRGKNAKNVVGTGIGLFLCKKIMLALGGDIKVESGKNKTCFTISLKR